jgi:predicted nuclease with TOPRIM domain
MSEAGDQLRRMEEKLDRVIGELQDVKHRATSLECQVALLHEDFAGQSARMDRIEARLDRIERRLELNPVGLSP